MKRIALAALLTGLLPALLSAESGNSAVVSKDAQAVALTRDVDVSNYERFSIQVDYSSTTPSEATISDGDFASATLTVADYSALNGQGASGTITLASGKNTSAIDGAIVTLGSKTFVEGVDWDRLATSTMTMADLKDAIDADWEYSATVSSNVVTVTYVDVGTAGNSYALTTSTGVLSVSAATLENGQPYGYFSINNVTLTEGTDWDAETSSDTTAINISAAINADATLSTIVSASTTSLGVVTVTAIYSGLNAYPIDTIDASQLTASVAEMAGGVATDIDIDDDTITETGHGFSTRLAVLFSNVSGTDPTGLTDQTTYYAIPTNDNAFQIASSAANAIAGTEIDITALTGGGSFTFTPIAFAAGSTGFDFRGSNDGTTFYDLTGESIGGVSVSSVTYSADGGGLWNFTDYPYKFIRFNFTAPTTGGLDLDVNLNWRK